MADRAELLSVAPGTLLIEQAAHDNAVYLILAGAADVVVNGRPVQVRGLGEHVGEMAAILPSQPRSASIVPREETVVAKLSEAEFAELASRHPQMYRTTATAESQSQRQLA